MPNITKRTNKDGDISYRIRVYVDETGTGKHIMKSKTWRPPANMRPSTAEKEAVRLAAIFEDQVKRGLIAFDSSTKFGEYAKQWIENAQIAPKTRVEYVGLMQRITLAFGHIKLEKLQSHHLEAFYRNLAEDGVRKSGSNAAAVKLKEVMIEKKLSAAALAREHTDAPKIKRKESKYLDDKQAQNFLELLLNGPDIRVKTAFILLLFTGMRRGELCGLSWGAIDDKNGIIHVKCASQYLPGQGVSEISTKTQSSIRAIKAPQFVFDILTEYRIWWNQKKLCYGREWKGELERLFIQDDGKPIVPDTINYWLNKFLKKHNFAHISPHSLRHTFATLQIAAGVDVRTLQARTGHAQASTLVNIYSHAIKSAQEAASDALESMLIPKAK